jgi:hypothetical protein
MNGRTLENQHRRFLFELRRRGRLLWRVDRRQEDIFCPSPPRHHRADFCTALIPHRGLYQRRLNVNILIINQIIRLQKACVKTQASDANRTP